MCSMNLKPKAEKINPVRVPIAFVDMWKRTENVSLITLQKSLEIYQN